MEVCPFIHVSETPPFHFQTHSKPTVSVSESVRPHRFVSLASETLRFRFSHPRNPTVSCSLSAKRFGFGVLNLHPDRQPRQLLRSKDLPRYHGGLLASQRTGNKLKGFTGLYLKATARIWPQDREVQILALALMQKSSKPCKLSLFSRKRTIKSIICIHVFLWWMHSIRITAVFFPQSVYSYFDLSIPKPKAGCRIKEGGRYGGRGCQLVPCTLNPGPYKVHPTAYALNPAPYTLNPMPQAPNPQPTTLNPKP